NDLNAVGTSTNPVGSVQFARNLLGLATGTATKNECSRAQRLYDRSKFRISCTSAANPKSEAECVLAGCCWLHSYNTYLINLLNIDASKNPLLSYLLNPNGNLGVSWQCVSPMNDATLNMLYTVTAVSEAQNILNNQNNQPVQSTPNTQNSLSQRRTQYADEEHSSQGSNLSMRCTNVVSRVDCGESEWDKCVQRGCCWIQTPGQPDCFLPAN
uniref:P-type domain-containing protein n=1 Tax=Ciona savignyi TaxID=51511 RepID=H2Y695_CIOSA